MKTMIYDTSIDGHHLEYINHLHNYIAEFHKEGEYVFVIPQKFQELKSNYEWNISNNISFIFIPDEQLNSINCVNQFKLCFQNCRLLYNFQKKIKCNEIILINLAIFIPLLPLFISSKIKINGIIYKIYLYEKQSFLKYIIDKFRYLVLSRCKVFQNIFILNDKKGTHQLNRLYKTSKFKYLPDPVPKKKEIINNDFRKDYHIPEDQIIFLHFGSLEKRKGTIRLLKAISLLPNDFKGTFIFAGKLTPDIKEEYLHLINILNKTGKNIISINEFVSEELMHTLYYTADCIIIPYIETSQSSGVIGYAALYNKPIIGSSAGLIGNLISEYSLGITISSDNLEDIYREIMNFSPYFTQNDYVISHSVNDFAKELLNWKK